LSDQEPTNETEQPDDQLEEEEGAEDEETAHETHDDQEEGSSEESEGAPQGKQEGDAATTPVAAGAAAGAQAVTWKENANDFDESTIEIGITLHPLKGRPPEERLVTFCIHNHSGPPVTNYYTQGQLTNESPLDRLLWATAQEIRKFRAELSRRKQEQFEREEQAKRSKRERRAAPTARLETSAAARTAVTTQAATGERETLPAAAQDARAVPATTTAPTTPASPKNAKQGSELVHQPLF
jgi:hypothetical protein